MMQRRVHPDHDFNQSEPAHCATTDGDDGLDNRPNSIIVSKNNGKGLTSGLNCYRSDTTTDDVFATARGRSHILCDSL